MRGVLAGVTGAGLLLMTGFSAQAAPPPDLENLVNSRSGQSEAAIRGRGYEFISSERRGDRVISLWWNENRRQCVEIVTYNGRFISIDSAPPGRCRRNEGPGFPGGPGGGRPPFGQTPQEVRDLVGMPFGPAEAQLRSRGFRFSRAASGSGPRTAFWWGPSQRYCLSIVSANGRFQTLTTTAYEACRDGGSNDPYPGPGYPGGGNRPIRDFSSFPGLRIPDADARLTGAGYGVVDRFRSGNSFYVIWYNRQNRQCLQMTNADSRVRDVRDILNHPQCR